MPFFLDPTSGEILGAKTRKACDHLNVNQTNKLGQIVNWWIGDCPVVKIGTNYIDNKFTEVKMNMTTVCFHMHSARSAGP